MERLSKLRADLVWSSMSVADGMRKHVLMPFQKVRVDEARSGPVRVLRDLPATMRDGVRLYADVYLPEKEGRYPTILTRLPYGKREYGSWSPVYGRFWARRGYAFVVQDVRGKFASEGEWEPFVNEVDDGYDTIEWIVAQPWSDGAVGVLGESYLGYTCWAAGLSNHPNLRCIAPGMTATDVYGDWAYRGGAFRLQTIGSWVISEEDRRSQNCLRLDHSHLPLESSGDAAGLRSGQYKAWLAHPTRDAYWDRLSLCDRVHGIAVPALHMGGWFDVFIGGTISDWRRATEADDRSVAENQWLIVGPNDHASTTVASRKVGRVGLGPVEPDPFYDAMKSFFDYWLKGSRNGFDSSPRVRYFVVGANVWRESERWPPEHVESTDYYLGGNGNASKEGSLSTTPPTRSPPDRFTYDPFDPVTISVRTDLWRMGESLGDRSGQVDRRDVLCYTTSELEEGMEMTGPVTATLFASTTAKDTDLVVTLVDVFPNGYSQLIVEGIVRTSYRLSDRERAPVEPGGVYECAIDMNSTSYLVDSGHRLRLEVTSSDFDRYALNLNTGGYAASETRAEKAVQEILHDSEHPSRITLPLNKTLGYKP